SSLKPALTFCLINCAKLCAFTKTARSLSDNLMLGAMHIAEPSSAKNGGYTTRIRTLRSLPNTGDNTPKSGRNNKPQAHQAIFDIASEHFSASTYNCNIYS